MAADGQMSAAGGAQRVSAWNLPNILTSVRILMVPFFAWALWVGGPWGGDSLVARWLALALFAAPCTPTSSTGTSPAPAG